MVFHLFKKLRERRKMGTSHDGAFTEIATDLLIKVSVDSIFAQPFPRLVLDPRQLVTRAIVNGVYIMFVKDKVVFMIAQGTVFEDAADFFSEILVKSAANIVAEILLNFVIDTTNIENVIPLERRSFSIGQILVTNITSAFLLAAFKLIRMGLMTAPNGGSPLGLI